VAPSDEATTETRWLGYARKQWLLASVVSAGVIAGGSISTFLETPRETFHWASEGMFGRDTYAGGADKLHISSITRSSPRSSRTSTA